MYLSQKEKEYIYAENLLIVNNNNSNNNTVKIVTHILCSFYPFSWQYVSPAPLSATVGGFTLGLASQRVSASADLCWDRMSTLMVSSSSPLGVNFIRLLTRFCTFSFLHWSLAPCRIPVYYVWCSLRMLDMISEYLKCRKQRCRSLGYPRNQFCPALALQFFDCPWVSCVQAWGVPCQPVPISYHLVPVPPAPGCILGPHFSKPLLL